MNYSHEVERMCVLAKGPKHGPAPIPEEGKWVKAYDIKDISGLTHGIGWCAPQQGACKLTLNVKDGIIEDLRLFRHDPFCRNGWGNPAWKNNPGGIEYGPGMRCHQRSNA